MTTLLSLPTEILVMIAQIVARDHPQDLSRLRRSRDRLREVTDEPFALAKFSKRYHVISPYSMRALLDITSHPFFGRYVEAVTISSVCYRDKRPPIFIYFSSRNPVEDAQNQELSKRPSNVFLESFPYFMVQVLANIKRNSGAVTVEVYGKTEFYEGLTPRRFFGWRNLAKAPGFRKAYNTIRAFRHVVLAAQFADCPLKRLDCTLNDGEDIRRPEFDSEIENFFYQENRPVEIRFCHEDSDIYYNHSSGDLDLCNLVLVQDIELDVDSEDNMIQVCTLSKILPHIRVFKLRLYDCLFWEPEHLGHLLRRHSKAIQSICISDTDMSVSFYGDELWSTFFEWISTLPDLKYFSVKCPRYSLAWFDDPDEDRELTLPLREVIKSPFEDFRLLFANGTDKFKATGDNVSAQV